MYDNSQVIQSWSSVPTKFINYNSEAQILTVTLNYDADIDLNTKYFQIDPSTSVNNTYSSYFYSSPISRVTLSSPFNNLATRFYS